ncbi:tudor domain-containing protein 7-like isoform X2 [Mya arenaria]|uniref:tudor domain-containing protein 7-like isoform X2 n=1 Tax=Mya arenaria TaxID=6604 RepID=UPI0022E579BE|nr:tudor domain-containing protein 7-like isoform X2 [Mya arenaria]
MAGDGELKMVKSMVRSVLLSCKEGVPADMLQRDYKGIVGEFIPWKKLGHASFENFIMSIPDVVRIERRGADFILRAVADETTAHIQKLVSKQKGKTLKKPARKPRVGGAGQFLSRGRGRPPQNRQPPRNYPGTPQRYGMPSFIPPPFVSKPLTPITVRVGNNAYGTRTIMVNKMLNRAVTDAQMDRQKPANSKFELPPRFRRQGGTPAVPQPHSTPVRRPPPSKNTREFASMANPESYINELKQHLDQTRQKFTHNTVPAAGGGFVCSLVINKNTYGSEDIFETEIEAEGAAAQKAIKGLNIRQETPQVWKEEIDWNTPTGGKFPVLDWAREVSREDRVDEFPEEQKQLIKDRVKQILETKKNGLWGTRIPPLYKETFNEEPPADLIDMIKSWTDIALVEFVANTDRDIVYPIIPDENMTLTIPREALIRDSEGEVIMYTSFVDTPGCFFCQREDSSATIDNICDTLQQECKTMSPVEQSNLKPGQFCAGVFSGDGLWTRAEVSKVNGKESAELLFVDYGNVDIVKLADIRWLSPATSKYPAQSIQCCLYGIEPVQGASSWSDQACKVFAELVEEQALKVVPMTVYENLAVEVDMYLKSDPTVSVSERLIKAGVAASCKQEEEDVQEKISEEGLHPAELLLPEDKEWDVHITYISSSTESVMLRLVGEEFSDKLDAYQSKLQDAFRSSPDETRILENHTYVAMDDDLFHRVRVISKGDKMVKCYFLDHGDTDDLLPMQLRALDPQINRMLPYQAVEVSLYGLEEVCTNITALERMCELALGKTCVAEVIDRVDIPAVVLYDTSGDSDLNINETILRTIASEGGGIDSPKTISPITSASQTPNRVLSPVPNIESRTDNTSGRVSSPVLNIETRTHNPSALPDNLKRNTSPRSDNRIPSIENNSSIPTTRTEAINDLNNDIQNMKVSNADQDNNSDQDNNNVSKSAINSDSVSRSSEGKSTSGLTPFVIPPVGEYIDVHVNFVEDPHSFVCIPYNEMGKLNKLLVDMLHFYRNTEMPELSNEEVHVGQYYAAVKDGIWYRVRVSSLVGQDLVSVYEADIGEHTAMMIAELRTLVPQFTQLPMMAFTAKLGGILPEGPTWSEAAKYKFIELARDHDLVGLVQGVDAVTGQVNLRLIDTSLEQYDVCVDEMLVKLQYASRL